MHNYKNLFSSEAEARSVCSALSEDFKGVVQPALDYMYEELLG